jgi:hypothetical protein
MGYLLVSSGSGGSSLLVEFGGFPIPWRELVIDSSLTSCPIVGLTTCRFVGIIQVHYDLLSFVIDILFYIGVGYSIVLAYAPTGVVLKKLLGR